MNLQINKEALETFCRKNNIHKLSLFGSVLRSDFNENSDVDVLVEFSRQHTPGLFAMARMQRELSELFNGRRVDLRTPQDLSRYFRNEVIAKAEVRYAA